LTTTQARINSVADCRETYFGALTCIADSFPTGPRIDGVLYITLALELRDFFFLQNGAHPTLPTRYGLAPPLPLLPVKGDSKEESKEEKTVPSGRRAGLDTVPFVPPPPGGAVWKVDPDDPDIDGPDDPAAAVQRMTRTHADISNLEVTAPPKYIPPPSRVLGSPGWVSVPNGVAAGDTPRKVPSAKGASTSGRSAPGSE